ncbi:21 kDa protein [Bienertia sinuspersici]
MKSSYFHKLLTSLLFLFLISLSFNLTLAASNKASTTNANFVKKCCSSTTYTKLCYATLLGYAAQIQNNPKRLAAKSLEVTLKEAQYVARITARLTNVRGLKRNERAALSDCTMAVDNSAAQLERSLGRMNRAVAWTPMEASDVQTWTSTAMTYAATCMEGLNGSGMNGKVKNVVESKIVKLTHLTSNALALIKRYYVAAARNAHHHNNHP